MAEEHKDLALPVMKNATLDTLFAAAADNDGSKAASPIVLNSNRIIMMLNDATC